MQKSINFLVSGAKLKIITILDKNKPIQLKKLKNRKRSQIPKNY
jgi:hypothetical protein